MADSTRTKAKKKPAPEKRRDQPPTFHPKNVVQPLSHKRDSKATAAKYRTGNSHGVYKDNRGLRNCVIGRRRSCGCRGVGGRRCRGVRSVSMIKLEFNA